MVFFAVVATVGAHAADEVLQHTSIEVQPTEITITISVLGGSESYRALQYELDQRADPELSAAEISSWLQSTWLPAMHFEVDGDPLTIDSSHVETTFSGPAEALFLKNPLVLMIRLPVPPDQIAHRLLIRNDYAAEHAEYRMDVLTAPGTDVSVTNDSAQDWSMTFTTDPASPGGPAVLASLSVAGDSGPPSVLDRLRENALWLIAGLLVAGVVGWLVIARRRDQIATRSVMPVRQSQVTRKKPVAVRTIDAPDE